MIGLFYMLILTDYTTQKAEGDLKITRRNCSQTHHKLHIDLK